MSEDPAYSVKQARQMLGNIGHTFIYELIGSGKLEALKLGGRTIIRGSAIRKCLASLPSATAAGAIRPADNSQNKVA